MKKQLFIPHFILLIAILIPGYALAGKIPLNHSVYDDWNNLARPQLSADGRWLSYEVNPQKGDGCLILVNLLTNEQDTIARGSRAVFSPGSDFVAYLILPEEKEIRQAKVEGKRRNEMPKNQLGIRRLFEDGHQLTDNVQSFDVAGEFSPWMVIHLAEMPEDTLAGTELIIYNPIDQVRHSFDHVTGYVLSENGRMVVFVQSLDQNGNHVVQAFNTQTQTPASLCEHKGRVKQIATDTQGTQAAFLCSVNDEEPYIYNLYHWQEGDDAAMAIVEPDRPGMPGGWSVSEHASPMFTEQGDRLFFGTAPIPAPEAEDTLLAEEKHRLDIWHYRDPLIQPMQLVQAEQEKKRTYTAVYHFDSRRMVQLADENMPDISTLQYGDGRLEMGESRLPYLIQNSFESGDYRDVYLVDIYTGERRLILEKHRGSVHRSRTGDPRISPGGNFLLYYNQADRHWHTLSVNGHNAVNITGAIPYPMYDELHDTPSDPDPHGIAGWVEDDRYVLIYDRFDVWRVDPTGEEAPVSLTNGYGRANNTRFRIQELDAGKTQIGRRERIMLSAFHIFSKQSGFYHIRMHRPGNPERMVMDDVRYFRPQKADDADVLLWQKSTFKTFPDLWVSDLFFNNPHRISNANPQQDQYLWGDVQLVEWVSFAGDSLQGLLYLPEQFDPREKYPMIVFFYERSSDGLHFHQVPAPSRSTINRSYCVSNGYVVFVPDIIYRIGYPGQSAYDAIVSGTKAMLNQFDFIDSKNIGLQGQSWAGYQIAWLITRTDMYKAAMAGAPVSNMISAYGGIRWATGMSRIYQYEETQSRIGGTIWDKTLRYIENSPVFFADRVNTPLLMMHNDADGAVPWYQGIEYFMALRRLGQPVWMLNYNDEAHNLTRRPNMMDLSKRMYQFFDHYLQGAPMPVWMKEGVPAIKKGVDNGYQTIHTITQ